MPPQLIRRATRGCFPNDALPNGQQVLGRAGRHGQVLSFVDHRFLALVLAWQEALGSIVQPVVVDVVMAGRHAGRDLAHLAGRVPDGVDVPGRGAGILGQGHGCAAHDEHVAPGLGRAELVVQLRKEVEDPRSAQHVPLTGSPGSHGG